MGKRTDIHKIMVIGSGPIVIGQAAEFDYAGTQACFALKEEGYEVVLVNSNPATIMTDKEMADEVYVEPLTLDYVKKILYKERPDAILPSLGGQTGLNMALELDEDGILDELNIELIGTNLDAIKKAEDRELFKELMESIGEPVPESVTVNTVEEAKEFCDKVGYPIIVRPAFTLGGSGGGICHNDEELREIVSEGLHLSPVTECLIERSIAGYKEIEYEVMRDSTDRSIVVCSMENFDPVGIHTGDSIVFAPNQSLTQEQNDMLSSVALKIIEALKIEGGCNVQLALNPTSNQYYVIEVNPRVSRSSALASKATGFPIARVSAKIAVGYHFDELYNEKTGTTFDKYDANDIDYTVAKVPRWSADKFKDSDRSLGTQMKATGEVMAIGSSIEESLMKAVRSLDLKHTNGLWLEDASQASDAEVVENTVNVKDDRLFYLAEAMRRGMSVKEANNKTQIAPTFLEAIEHLIHIENSLKDHPNDLAFLKEAKENGFSDQTIATLWNTDEQSIRQLREENDVLPSYVPVTMWTTESGVDSNYLYSTYQKPRTPDDNDRKSILVIGSGPIRIGQGIEFDYATVHCVQALREMDYEAIIINSNPETVSTDFSISNKLYFEPTTFEDVLNVVQREKPEGVIVTFGGQNAINLAESLEDAGVKILGTSVKSINTAEDRDEFEQLLKALNIPQPAGDTATTVEEAKKIPEEIGGYPVLVRPSFVLGGRGMDVVENEEALVDYMTEAIKDSNGEPVLIDHYVNGTEVEVDAVGDGKSVFIPGIMEHVEHSGVHSGDSMAVYPSQTLSYEAINTITDYTQRIGAALEIKGLFNIQFIVADDTVYVIEVNPRASRTVPFLTKVTNVPITNMATKAIMGQSLEDMNVEPGLYPVENTEGVHVKAPVFSFQKLNGVDPVLGPEMKSTGEVMGSASTYPKALDKAFEAAGTTMDPSGKIMLILDSRDYERTLPLLRSLFQLGYSFITTPEYADYLSQQGIKSESLASEADAINYIENKKLELVVDTSFEEHGNQRALKNLRISAIAHFVPLMTAWDTFEALVTVLTNKEQTIKAL